MNEQDGTGRVGSTLLSNREGSLGKASVVTECHLQEGPESALALSVPAERTHIKDW